MEQKIFFKNSDGLRLCGILSNPKQNTKKCIVLCHGITVDKNEDGIFIKLAQELVDTDFAVFRFDFRGHGESEGKSIDLTVEGEKKDIEAAFDFLKKLGYSEFGLLGASFAGGAVSLFVSSHQKLVKALVLWNAGIDYREKLNPTLPWPKKYWGKPAFERVEKYGFTEISERGFKVGRELMKEIKTLKPWKELIKVSIPTLFVHGDRDTFISYKDSVKYSKMMKNARLETIHGAEHGFHDNKEQSGLSNKVTIEFFLKNM